MPQAGRETFPERHPVHNGKVSLYNQGLHFCEHPLDTWSYYNPNDGSHYAEVEADGVSDKTAEDSKRVASSLTVKAEIMVPLVGTVREFNAQAAVIRTAAQAVFAERGGR